MARRRNAVDPVYSPERPLVTLDSVADSLQSLVAPVALTGGTGFVGSHLVDVLCAGGVEPRVLVRSRDRARWISRCPVRWVDGDLGDAEALRRLVEGAGTVIHLAGVLRGANAARFMEGNRDGTRRLVEAVSQHAPGAGLVQVSSQAAVGPADREVGATVDIEPNPISAYGRSKWAAEQSVRRFDGRWSVLRPPAVYGPRDTDVFEFFKMASRGLLAAPRGERWVTLAHVADVVRAVLATAVVGGAGATYHVGALNARPMTTVLRAIAETGGLTARLVPIPTSICRGVGWAGSALRRLGMANIPLSRDKIEEILAQHWVLETRSSLRRLGLAEPISLEGGLGETWDWYRRIGWL